MAKSHSKQPPEPPPPPLPSRGSGKRTSKWRRFISLALLVVLFGGGAYFFVPFWRLSSQFADRAARQPSRLYGAATTVEVGTLHEPEALVRTLRWEGYREAEGNGLPPGRYRATDRGLEVHLRRFPGPRGVTGGGRVEIDFRGSRVRELRVEGRSVDRVRLPPPLLASYYGESLEERRPVAVDSLPEELVEAVLAAEDDAFFHHAGLSVTGIARAAWINLRGGEIRQGGSTLTQQLVKNLYLTHERTLGRKVQEAILAILVDLRYDKGRILEAYLDEIYLGSSNGVNLIGVGAASRAFFSKEPAELNLSEAATLAGMIRAPALYSPVRYPDAARERRDWVLGRMVELGWLDSERAEAAKARSVRVDPHPVVRRRAPYFSRVAAEEAARRFGLDDLEGRGYTLLSTLRVDDQEAAREAVGWGVEALESGWQKGARVKGPLQAALVSLDPDTGGIRAYVGGRDYALSQYDRAGQARRQAGSAFKPVVYATAFELGVAAPSSFIEDAPLTVRLAGRRWSPQNSNGEYAGWISARTALERSLNTATARLALDTGLEPIVENARRMGVAARLDEVPSLALGAFEVSPLEMATVYATLARGGIRPPVHGLDGVLDPLGQPVEGRPLAEPERALSAEVAYMVTSVLQGVLDRGTGAGVRSQGLRDPLAGKTGTSNERRDSWFAGYSPEKASVVWVGYDDNSPTRMSGARAALPIWARFTAATRPPGGYADFDRPPGVVTAGVDPVTGELATDGCPEVIREVFLRGHAPRSVCRLHDRGRRGDWRTRDDDRRRRGSVRRWLDRVFGDGDD